MPAANQVVIAGGGVAGIRTAQGLRDLGYSGNITIFSEEPETPYHRPDLSKAFLSSPGVSEVAPLLTASTYEALSLQLELGRKAAGLDVGYRSLVLDDGETVPYDAVVIATGGSPRTLGGLEGFKNVFTLRSVDDARRIALQIRPGSTIGIVGGGFIGLEVASAALSQGCRAVVIEAGTAPLSAAVGIDIARIIQSWHEAKGVDFRVNTTVDNGVGSTEHITGLALSGGEVIPVDAVVVGIGVAPEVEWLRDSKLHLDRGVVCDEVGRTSERWVYAVGDVAQRHYGRVVAPTGHWTSAAEQGRRTAAAMVGRTPPVPRADTYFWSDQHGRKLQCVGRFPSEGQVVIEVGDPSKESFVACCRSNGDLIGAFALSAPTEFTRYRLELQRAGIC
jgi:3-phenylpropionate/trans-cinnamate dioxygenase ferredoxin reductase subunit